MLKDINEGLLNNGLRIMLVADMLEGIRKQTGTVPLIERRKGVVIATYSVQVYYAPLFKSRKNQ